jgi:hypothetical protein
MKEEREREPMSNTTVSLLGRVSVEGIGRRERSNSYEGYRNRNLGIEGRSVKVRELESDRQPASPRDNNGACPNVRSNDPASSLVRDFLKLLFALLMNPEERGFLRNCMGKRAMSEDNFFSVSPILETDSSSAINHGPREDLIPHCS